MGTISANIGEALRFSVTGSLLAVWVLVGLFFYLNRYTKRRYFTIWAVAWLLYAIWLSLLLGNPMPPIGSPVFVLQQLAVASSAVFLLWGSVSCLSLVVRDRLMILFLVFVGVWSYVAQWYLDSAVLVQLPMFALTGASSFFVGGAFLRFRRKNRLVGAGLLFCGFVLWGMFLASFPFAQKYPELISIAFVVSTGLQLFIAVSMIVLVLEEVRESTNQMRAELDSIRAEQRAAQLKMLGRETSSLLAQNELPANLQDAYVELRRTQHIVVQQERLRALGQMASGIAHDINNALCPIVSYSELLLQDTATAENKRRQLGHIQTAARDITHIVARMRDFYRRRTTHDELTNVNIAEIVDEVVELTRPRWRDMAQGQGITIAVEKSVEPALPELEGQETELREALTNLVLNAVDAMPQGGTISISAESKFIGTRAHLLLAVSDTGMGMTEEVRKRCLEPFFSTKEHRGGSGLGLAMVYGMVQRHDGSIDIHSEVGRGTRIELALPMRTAAHVAPAESAAADLTKLRILCIDDEPMLRQVLQQLLASNGHEVETQPDGAAGLRAFGEARHQNRPFDVVITDLGMPGHDGVAVARAIRNLSAQTPIILLTGWGTVLGHDAEQAALFDAILSKPPRMAELLNTITRVLKDRRISAAA